jgi:hypothetical protein
MGYNENRLVITTFLELRRVKIMNVGFKYIQEEVK